MHQRQASVAFQVVPQPLILTTSMSRQDITNNLTAAARSSASSSSSLVRRSSLLKRDSAVSLGHAGSRSDARRISVRRSFQSAEAAFIEDDLAEFLAEQPFAGNMGPVYRLVRCLSSFPFLHPGRSAISWPSPSSSHCCYLPSMPMPLRENAAAPREQIITKDQRSVPKGQAHTSSPELSLLRRFDA